MNTKRTHLDWSYWLAWVVANILGFVMGAVLGTSLAYGPLFKGVSDAALSLVTGIVIGILGSYLQWVVLRERIAVTPLWALTGALGFGLATGSIGAVASDQNNAMVSILMIVTIFGFGGGILQWLILRQKVEHAGWWLLANCLGTLIGILDFPLVIALGGAGKWMQSILMFGAFFGAGYGAVTGAALVWFLRRPKSSNSQEMVTPH